MIINDVIYIALQILMCIGLFILAGVSQKLPNAKWKLCYLAPMLLFLLMSVFSGMEKLLVLVYAGSFLAALGFFLDKKLLRRIVCALCIPLTASGFILGMTHPAYRATDYLAEFDEGFSVMQKRYALAEFKDIDWDELSEKYRPMFKEAADTGDDELGCKAWMMLCAEFKDGNTFYIPEDEQLAKDVYSKAYGKDHGLVIMNLSDGRAAAVCVDPTLNELGIRNGTIITSWNGKTPDEAAKSSEAYSLVSYPDSDNAEFFGSFLAAGTGSKVTVGFIGEDGSEQTVELSGKGSFFKRAQEALAMIGGGFEAPDLSWTPVSDTAAVLRIVSMGDTKNGSAQRKAIRDGFEELRAQGIRDAIIDLRGASGSASKLVNITAELFSPEGKHTYCCTGVRDNREYTYKKESEGKYVVGKTVSFKGEDMLGGGRIVMLVDSECRGGAEHIVRLLGETDGVTVIGMTDTNGSGQGVTVASLGSGTLSMSAELLLNDDGSVWLDAGKDGQSEITLDERVELDEETVIAIFDEGRDVVMEKAIEIISR